MSRYFFFASEPELISGNDRVEDSAPGGLVGAFENRWRDGTPVIVNHLVTSHRGDVQSNLRAADHDPFDFVDFRVGELTTSLYLGLRLDFNATGGLLSEPGTGGASFFLAAGWGEGSASYITIVADIGGGLGRSYFSLDSKQTILEMNYSQYGTDILGNPIPEAEAVYRDAHAVLEQVGLFQRDLINGVYSGDAPEIAARPALARAAELAEMLRGLQTRMERSDNFIAQNLLRGEQSLSELAAGLIVETEAHFELGVSIWGAGTFLQSDPEIEISDRWVDVETFFPVESLQLQTDVEGSVRYLRNGQYQDVPVHYGLGVASRSSTGLPDPASQTGTEIADSLAGGAEADMLIGLDGSDTLRGNGGDDSLAGGADDDRLFGGRGNDLIEGGEGHDRLEGLEGNDRLFGDAGNDTAYGGDGTDTLDGGDGDDFLFGGSSTADLRDVMFGGDGHDSMDGGWGNDELHGGDGNDTLLGDFGADTLIGNAGNDLIAGGGGADLIFGGPGNDFLNGGWGYDRLNGGAGADRFFHLGIPDHGIDWVQDYNAAEGDLLQFGIPGAQKTDFLVAYTSVGSAGSRPGLPDVAEGFVVYRPTGQIMWALVDGDAQTSINILIGGQVYDLLA